MKIMDEKGRLFGKINVIDFLVILFIFCLTPMFVFGYRLFAISPEPEQKEAIEKIKEITFVPKPERAFSELNFDFLFIKLKPEVVKMITRGDKEVDETGETIAEIVDIGKASPYIHKLNLSGGEEFVREDKFLKQIPAVVKMKVEIIKDILYYKGRPIEKGCIAFNADKYIVEGKFLFAPKVPQSDLSEQVLNNLENMKVVNKKVGVLRKKIDMILSSPKIQRLIEEKE